MRASSAPRRTFCPSAAVTCRIDPLTSARTFASFSAASVPEINGPVLMSCVVTVTTFSGPICTATGAAGAGGGGSLLARDRRASESGSDNDAAPLYGTLHAAFRLKAEATRTEVVASGFSRKAVAVVNLWSTDRVLGDAGSGVILVAILGALTPLAWPGRRASWPGPAAASRLRPASAAAR